MNRFPYCRMFAGLVAVLALAVILPLSFMNVGIAHAQIEDEDLANALIAVAASTEMMADWLPNFEGWKGYAHGTEYPDVYYVEFYDNAEEEWLGYVTLNSVTGEIYESFAPKPLPPDVYAETLPRIEQLILDDPEVAALLVDPIYWDIYTDYNRWDQVWETSFYRGLEAFTARAYFDMETGDFWLDSITDQNALSEAEALRDARDRAISLAYDADGVDRALNGYDDWTTIVQHMRGSQWSVSFVVPDRELFYALVDLATGRVVEASPGR